MFGFLNITIINLNGNFLIVQVQIFSADLNDELIELHLEDAVKKIAETYVALNFPSFLVYNSTKILNSVYIVQTSVPDALQLVYCNLS